MMLTNTEIALKRSDITTRDRIIKYAAHVVIDGQIWYDTSNAYVHYEVLYLCLRGLCVKDEKKPWFVKLL